MDKSLVVGRRVRDNSPGSANRPAKMGTVKDVELVKIQGAVGGSVGYDLLVKWDGDLMGEWVDSDDTILEEK